MNTIRTANLVLRQGRDRSYVIDLVELDAGRYLVNYRYGFVGGALKEGTRTPDPVDRTTAERLFESLIQTRTTQGYEDAGEPTPWDAKPAGPSAVASETGDPRTARLLYLLERAGSMADESASKLIWRIGQVKLAAAAPVLASFRHEAGPIANRVLPYALYRCGNDSPDVIGPALQALANDGDPAVNVPARIALSCLSNPTDEAKRLAENLPLAVAGALQTNRDAAVAQITGYMNLASSQALMAKLPAGSDYGAEQQQTLVDLFLISRHEPKARPLVMDVLRQTPFAPFLFRGMRQVFKAAEALDDAEVFGLFAYRFDETRSNYAARYGWIYNPATGRGMKKADAIGKDDTQVAWSDKTRDYFRRRIWRDLRKRGDLDDPAYVDLATACLIQTGEVSDNLTSSSKYSWASRGLVTKTCPAIAHRFALHNIMHGAAERLLVQENSLVWQFQLDDPNPKHATSREAPYPHLWDARPDALLRILLEAEADVAQNFAFHALLDNTPYCLDIPAATITRLLRRDRYYTYHFALEIARVQLARRADTVGPLIPALFATGKKEAVELAQTALTLKPSLATEDEALAADLFLSVSEVTRDWLDGFWAQHAATANLPDLIDALVYQAEAHDWPFETLDEDKARMRIAADLITKHFGDAVRAAPAERLIALSRADEIPPKLLAILLAAARPDGISTFDPAALAEEDDPDLQAAGAQMLAEADVEALKGREDLILAFLQSPVPASRTAAVTATARLAEHHKPSAQTLAKGIVPILYRAEVHEGAREDAILAARTDAIMAALVSEGPDFVWPMLRAKAEPARRVGSEVLQHLGPNSFSLRKTARIGTNDQAIARRWAVDALEKRIDQVSAEPEQIFALLDGKWDDSREAAYQIIRTRLDPSDWEPETVVALCDCVTPPAQAFGREMLNRAFSDANADLFLRRLSEHPSNGFRLTVARLIREHAAGDPAKLRDVEPALRTILSRVFSSRAAKGQAYAFISEEIDRGDPASLAIFSELLERISATCAIGDRARILSLIMRLKTRNPDLVPLAEVVEPEIRGAV